MSCMAFAASSFKKPIQKPKKCRARGFAFGMSRQRPELQVADHYLAICLPNLPQLCTSFAFASQGAHLS